MVVHDTIEPAFLRGGGEMGQLIRAKDWSSTPLGSPADWPLSLRTAVSLMLNSQFPMFVWWGDPYTTIYNDAYREILGEKHPHALGEPGPEVWSEIWDVVGPLAANVRDKGISNYAEDQLLFINRRGYIEETYFTFSYSPVLDEHGKIHGVFCACTETTEKVLTTRKLAESEQSLRNMILQAPAAMCILKGETFVIEVANDKMLELWGLSADYIGRPVFDALPDARTEGYEDLLLGVLETGEPFIGKDQPVSLPRNGAVETVFVDLIYKPVRELNGSISAVMAMAIDVTQQVTARRKIEEVVKQRTAELANANEALVKTNQELSRSNNSLEEFAHAASHDMKEPIRKVLNFSSRLRGSLEMRLDETEKELFNRVETAAHRMGRLVDDLLEFSHVNHRPVEMEEIDLNLKVNVVLTDLELLIDEKQATIEVGKLPTIKGYRRQIQQLFQNLVGNALKYTRPGEKPRIIIAAKQVLGKEVSEHVSPTQQDNSFYLIEITDNGIGFEPQYAQRIFGMFQRLHGKQEYPGSGVGLSIARKVVENHHGYIWAESQLGKGASFKVLLPVN
jgi:PAS domain S-box-containing protein